MASVIALFVGDSVGRVTGLPPDPARPGRRCPPRWRALGLNAPTGRADTPNEGGPSWVIAGPGLPG